jgi:predicted glycogen debranching enzyme
MRLAVDGLALAPAEELEWLEADGLGGFASGTTLGINTRRYHALLLAAVEPPAGRQVLVNDAVVWLETPAGRVALSSHRFAPSVTALADVLPGVFFAEPWPRFESVVHGLKLWREVIALHGLPVVLLSFEVERPMPGWRLCVRPLLSGRGFHALHQENGACRLAAEVSGERVLFQTYPSVPRVVSLAEASFASAPDWYRRCQYERERERGLDHVEDLASPGVLTFDLGRQPRADWILAADDAETRSFLADRGAREVARDVRQREGKRRAGFSGALERAGDAYLVRRGSGKTIIAGYPWFGDWGRDTFIAVRGLCLATGRLREAADILLAWAGSVSEGMLPNRFADAPGEAAEYNSVDAALWYVLAVGELILADSAGLASSERASLERAVGQIIRGHLRGTRHGIHVESDGLLAAGARGVQLTWMDAKIGDWVVTPRVGKPVEVQALWLNALNVAGRLGHGNEELLQRGLLSFSERFDTGADGLFDVVDVDHLPGVVDASVRPNQVLALGGLPLALLPASRCRQVLQQVEQRLWTPIGLRSLAPGEPGYVPHYEGGPFERDSAYHQGTVWPWLLGPFIEAWVKCRGNTEAARAEARARFAAPWLRHLSAAGVGHVCEIADADPPHAPRGCPFQAWSVSELLRVQHQVLRAGPERATAPESGQLVSSRP